MKPTRIPLPKGFLRGLRQKDISELESLLDEMKLREGATVGPLTRQREAVERTLRKKWRERGGRTPLVEYDIHDTGLPAVSGAERSEPSAGDANLLMTRVSIIEPPFDRILRDIAARLIRTTGGLLPAMEIKSYDCEEKKGQRFVVRWTVPRAITTGELHAVEQVTRQAYECEITGHRKSGAGWESVIRYVDLQDKTVPARAGIYFGTAGYYDSAAEGVAVHRRFVNAAEARYLMQRYPDDWLGRSIERKAIQTDIEVREGYTNKNEPGLAQDNFLFLVVQLSYLLAKQRLIDERVLMTAIYRELNRVGTNPIDREMLYGMRGVLRTIERVLLLALQRPHLARHYKFRPESVLLVGVPGIGKTFLAHYLMTGEYNALFASLDSGQLHQDLAKSGSEGASSICLRIDKIREATTLPVILLIDDIDVILDEEKEEEMVSKFLTLMQGIRQKGFHILASTNHPEKMDKRILEPGRLSKVIHVPLPDRADRAGVLRNHLATLPFGSADECERVIQVMADRTDGWTQRYLWEICVEAARFCGLAANQPGVAEETAVLAPITVEHFEQAYAELLKCINLQEIRDWDDRIAKFVSNASREIGLHVGRIS